MVPCIGHEVNERHKDPERADQTAERKGPGNGAIGLRRARTFPPAAPAKRPVARGRRRARGRGREDRFRSASPSLHRPLRRDLRAQDRRRAIPASGSRATPAAASAACRRRCRSRPDRKQSRDGARTSAVPRRSRAHRRSRRRARHQARRRHIPPAGCARRRQPPARVRSASCRRRRDGVNQNDRRGGR